MATTPDPNQQGQAFVAAGYVGQPPGGYGQQPGQPPSAQQPGQPQQPPPPLSPQEQAKQDAEKLSQGEKTQIIADAVQGYLRTNYITGVTLVVCEDFVAQCTKAARAAAQQGQGQQGQQPPDASQQPPQGHGGHYQGAQPPQYGSGYASPQTS